MEFKQIKELMSAMARTGLKRISIKREGFEIELERENNAPVRNLEQIDYLDEPPARRDQESYKPVLQTPKTDNLGALASGKSEVKEESPGTFVTSPMVGTFYTSPSPEDPAFVKVGDRIEKDTIICIIEAMKVMNEVKAGKSGVVAEILVDNGHPVEFGTKLFRIT